MAWYDEVCFYHIYPLGMLGCPKNNEYGPVTHRLKELEPWIGHIKAMGFNGIYIGPLFESVGHGYETTDYKKLDSRLGDNEDLKWFVNECHKAGIKVIFDGVFNHTGRDFFAFKNIKENRENSPYKDWYCNVNFWGNNEYNDGFSYENWGGYNLLAKLNQRNSQVKDYICDVIRFWVSEFDVDGIRLDAADVLDFDFMKCLRTLANEVKPDFYLMGEVIHGDYNRWANADTLHAVTNYHLHKALYSGHNDHNYFEIAHTVKRLYEMGGSRTAGLKLYNFVDNHDVERIHTKLNNKAHMIPAHILLYTLPGVPSVYYGSEFGIEGRKERGSDDSLRPALSWDNYKNAIKENEFTAFVARLGKIRRNNKVLSYGEYKELMLTNRQYAFARTSSEGEAIVMVNNDDNPATINVNVASGEYVGLISGQRITVEGNMCVSIPGNSGEIWVQGCDAKIEAPVMEVLADNEQKASHMEIRPAKDSDIEGLNRLLYQVCMVHHNGRPDIFRAGAKKYTDQQLLEIIHNDETPIFVAVDENDYMLGYAFCIFQKNTDSNVLMPITSLYIDDLCVDENVRGQHVGTRLYQHVLCYAREMGCYNVTLNVWSLNEGAMKFYEACGLKPQKVGMETIL